MTISCAPAPGVKTRQPPRPPISHSLDREHCELTIVDCDGRPETYRILPIDGVQFGRAVQLVNVGYRFGTTYHCHLDDDGTRSCSCPGYIFSGACKHMA